MQRSIFYKTHLILIILTLLGCESEEVNKIEPDNVGEGVELYLINTYETIDNQCQIDECTVITKAKPLVYYSDFISYDSKNYIFEISEESKIRIESLEPSTQGIPFALKVDGELIYTGYFMYNHSSIICNWLIFSPVFNDSFNGLRMHLRYPENISGTEIPDKRNDIRILDVFRQDNKLIE